MYFPRQTSFLLRSLGFMGISSMILTIVIILSFFITIYIIFKQKKLSEIKNDFVSNMTHELKTPISTISLASQMLNDNSIPDKSKNLGNISRIISDESKRLGYQVEKVLQMAIFDRGRIKLKKKKTDINELVHQVVTSFALQVKNKNGLMTESYKAENANVEVDPVHFTNLISNLVDNAIKYSGDDPRVGIATYNKNGKLCIRVRDNGIGIKKEDQKRIFEKFYRVPTGNVHNVKGFGLGLSYVKKIVEEHQGSVSLRSEVNKGTEFELSIPLTISK
ncbi:Sensor histidine kinase ResE [subsurface metagenome]